MAEMKKLKPCPFCGGQARMYKTRRYEDGGWETIAYRIECQQCYVKTVEFAGSEFAAACWNVRVNDGRDNEAED